MLDIYDGRSAFYQWDINQKLRVSHKGVCEVHFSNPVDDTALVVKPYDLDTVVVADVPNILLQNAGKITAYVYVCIGDECTIHEKDFTVRPRLRPSDYVYTETDVRTIEDAEEAARRAEAAADRAEAAGGGGPVTIEETDPTVPAWAKQPEKPTYTPEEIGAQPAGDYALAADVPTVADILAALPTWNGGAY